MLQEHTGSLSDFQVDEHDAQNRKDATAKRASLPTVRDQIHSTRAAAWPQAQGMDTDDKFGMSAQHTDDNFGMSVLHYMAMGEMENNVDRVDLLIKTWNEHVNRVDKLLLATNASISCRSLDSKSPLNCAVEACLSCGQVMFEPKDQPLPLWYCARCSPRTCEVSQVSPAVNPQGCHSANTDTAPRNETDRGPTLLGTSRGSEAPSEVNVLEADAIAPTLKTGKAYRLRASLPVERERCSTSLAHARNPTSSAAVEESQLEHKLAAHALVKTRLPGPTLLGMSGGSVAPSGVGRLEDARNDGAKGTGIAMLEQKIRGPQEDTSSTSESGDDNNLLNKTKLSGAVGIAWALVFALTLLFATVVLANAHQPVVSEMLPKPRRLVTLLFPLAGKLKPQEQNPNGA